MPSTFPGKGLLLGPEATSCLDGLARRPQDAPVSSFQTLELQVPEVWVTMPGILTGLLRMELGLHVCEAGTFPPELSPQS